MSHTIRLLSVAAVSSLAAAGALGAGPAAAAAAPVGPEQCASRHVCLWEHGRFTGAIWPKSGFTQYADTPGYIHDKASSWANHNVNRRECVYDYVNGARVTLQILNPGQEVGVVPNGTNDRADAVGWC